MSEIEDVTGLLNEAVEANGEQASRLAQAVATLRQSKERAAFIYGEQSQAVGRFEQAQSYVNNAVSSVANLGAYLESAVEFMATLEE
jgi:hypothetical protein